MYEIKDKELVEQVYNLSMRARKQGKDSISISRQLYDRILNEPYFQQPGTMYISPTNRPVLKGLKVDIRDA